MTDLDKRISEYAKWIESRYDDSHELRGKGKNGYIDGKADAYERGMDDDLTFQTVRELAGTAYMAGRSAPPTDAEVEAVAKRLCWNSCEWDGIESDYVAKDEDDAWDYAGEICGYQEDYIARAKEVLEVARKAVTE